MTLSGRTYVSFVKDTNKQQDDLCANPHTKKTTSAFSGVYQSRQKHHARGVEDDSKGTARINIEKKKKKKIGTCRADSTALMRNVFYRPFGKKSGSRRKKPTGRLQAPQRPACWSLQVIRIRFDNERIRTTLVQVWNNLSSCSLNTISHLSGTLASYTASTDTRMLAQHAPPT